MKPEQYIGIMVGEDFLHLRKESNEGHGACGLFRYTLIGPDAWDYGDTPVFRIKDERHMRQFIRTGSVKWYNSDADTPDWGRFINTLTLRDGVRFVTVTTTVTDLEVSLPPVIKFTSIIKDFDHHILASPIRRRFNLPDDVTEAFIVYRGVNGYEVDPETMRQKLTGHEITHREVTWGMYGIEQLDDDSYYVLLRDINHIL